MPKLLKSELPEELLDATLKTILGWNKADMLNKFFDLDTIIKNNGLQNYIKSEFGTTLRKYIYVNTCRKLRPCDEHLLDEKDLLVILKAVLRLFGYQVYASQQYFKYIDSDGNFYLQYKIRHKPAKTTKTPKITETPKTIETLIL